MCTCKPNQPCSYDIVDKMDYDALTIYKNVVSTYQNLLFSNKFAIYVLMKLCLYYS